MITMMTRRAARRNSASPLSGLLYWWDGKGHATSGVWVDSINGKRVGDRENTAAYNGMGMTTGSLAQTNATLVDSTKATLECVIKVPSSISTSLAYEGQFRGSYYSNPGTKRWSWGIVNGKFFFWTHVLGYLYFSNNVSALNLGQRNALTLTFNNSVITLYVNGSRIGSVTATNWSMPTSAEANSNKLTLMIRNEGNRWQEINSGKVWARILSDEEILLSSTKSLNYYSN